MWECQLPALHLFPGSCTLMLEPQSSAAPRADNARCTPTMPAARHLPLSAAFVWEEGAYRAKTFNFYIFPRPFEGSDKRFVCQARTHQLGRAALSTPAGNACTEYGCCLAPRLRMRMWQACFPGRMLRTTIGIQLCAQHCSQLASNIAPSFGPIRPPQASSMAFLASCGFDFNKAIYDGVGYLTGEGGCCGCSPCTPPHGATLAPRRPHNSGGTCAHLVPHCRQAVQRLSKLCALLHMPQRSPAWPASRAARHAMLLGQATQCPACDHHVLLTHSLFPAPHQLPPEMPSWRRWTARHVSALKC